MRYSELIEGSQRPIVVVDVQPEYLNPGYYFLPDLARLLAKHKGRILMFVNADETGMTDDSVEHDIIPYWEDIYERIGYSEEDFYDKILPKLEFYDKGYGYFRGWMDSAVGEKSIIKTIREMYRQKVADSRDLFDGDLTKLNAFVDDDAVDEGLLKNEPITVEWVSLEYLRKFNNCYICGGGRNECLKEVQLLMNAFNIKYTEISRFIY
jgi:hypothetical protein